MFPKKLQPSSPNPIQTIGPSQKPAEGKPGTSSRQVVSLPASSDFLPPPSLYASQAVQPAAPTVSLAGVQTNQLTVFKKPLLRMGFSMAIACLISAIVLFDKAHAIENDGTPNNKTLLTIMGCLFFIAGIFSISIGLTFCQECHSQQNRDVFLTENASASNAF